MKLNYLCFSTVTFCKQFSLVLLTCLKAQPNLIFDGDHWFTTQTEKVVGQEILAFEGCFRRGFTCKTKETVIEVSSL